MDCGRRIVWSRYGTDYGPARYALSLAIEGDVLVNVGIAFVTKHVDVLRQPPKAHTLVYLAPLAVCLCIHFHVSDHRFLLALILTWRSTARRR